MVEDRYPERGQPAVNRHPAVDASVDGDAVFNPALDWRAAIDRVTSVYPALDGIETLNGQSPFKWVYALDEFAQPRLFCAPTWEHAIEPIWRQPALRRVPRWGWAEAINGGRPIIQKVPSLTGPFFSVETLRVTAGRATPLRPHGP